MSLKKLQHSFNKRNIEFTNVEKDILKIILNHDDITNSSCSKIAREVPCNHSSVSRMIKKIGFKSWEDFVISCILESKVETKIGINTIQEKILLEIASAQTFLQEPATKNKIKEITEIINESNEKLIFYGYRLSGNIAQYITWIFNQSETFAIHTYFIDELYGFLTPNSILIAFSDELTNNETIKAIKKARTIGAKVIVISIGENKEIENIAHISIAIPQLHYFLDYKYNSILSKELLRHVGLVIWEEYQTKFVK